MANKLSKTGIVSLATIKPWHVSQSIDAFTGLNDYDITLSGSLVVTGSVAINGLTNTIQNSVLTYDTNTGLLYYTASSTFAVNNFYTSSITQSITSSTVNNTINNSTINQTIISSSVNQPAPSEYYIQYNSASMFGASSYFQYIYPSESLQHGDQSFAVGFNSHAEGKGTLSLGMYSHAEGQETYVNSRGAHAEGFQTSASGDYSHAEGNLTKTSAPFSHAEGTSTRATATGSHAEGIQTQAIGNYSHAEGGASQAIGIYSHAEGFTSLARGIGSHAEGQQTFAIGTYSHTEGYLTTSSANYSHAEGYSTVTNAIYQHVQGQFNQPSSVQSAFIIGNGVSDISRSNLVFAAGSTFQVTGSINLTQNLTVGGGYRPNTKIVDPSNDPTILVTDHVVLAAPSSPGGIIYLPSAPVENMQIVIMRTELTPAFTVAPLGGFLINGLSSYTFPASAYTRKTFTFFGSRWFVESN
jgi:hypothetical protein